ncbi:hypothetical protein H8S95_05430 [Pontibacter sp. KCTC 32443]|uniref:hypothetical protein n=1 Tax=Pontibacter TaxID=323449 RepID=UPI00164E7E26|nr:MULTISPECIES: hypothetical protein [Pontibacter]MBC5773497.1 hypothetical protein [Pontibacter sp. KCTC 32443]
MKQVIKSSLKRIVRTSFGWKILYPFAVLGRFAYAMRNTTEARENLDENNKFDRLFHSKKVLNGHFKNMVYPSMRSVGSSLYPKLLGSYEKELEEALGNLLNNSYSSIIDIGCAEGYYAVGLGLKFKESNIIAYDIDDKARKLCLEMAKMNGLSDRFEIRGECTPFELSKLVSGKRCLIICDCEGYEKYLFNELNLNSLSKSDLIIETHDFIDISISNLLFTLISETHNIELIKSIDDIQKVKTYSYKELNSFSLYDKFLILKEERPAIMEWLICTPKNIII